jgi:carboxymethylenebutenolidase
MLDAALNAAGIPHEFHTYEGAGHAFFAVTRPAYRPDAAVDGWSKILAFLARTVA